MKSQAIVAVIAVVGGDSYGWFRLFLGLAQVDGGPAGSWAGPTWWAGFGRIVAALELAQNPSLLTHLTLTIDFDPLFSSMFIQCSL